MVAENEATPMAAPADRSEITRRLTEVYNRIDSRLDLGLAAAQSEALHEEW